MLTESQADSTDFLVVLSFFIVDGRSEKPRQSRNNEKKGREKEKRVKIPKAQYHRGKEAVSGNRRHGLAAKTGARKVW